jgi:hypothetical protein
MPPMKSDTAFLKIRHARESGAYSAGPAGCRKRPSATALAGLFAEYLETL